MKRLELLSNKIQNFINERDWKQFQSPKNIAIGLSIEASELLEIFLWLNKADKNNLDSVQMGKISDEVGDILIYLLNFCNHLDLNPIDCANKKLRKDGIKYPIELVKGKAKKYTEYPSE